MLLYAHKFYMETLYLHELTSYAYLGYIIVLLGSHTMCSYNNNNNNDLLAIKQPHTRQLVKVTHDANKKQMKEARPKIKQRKKLGIRFLEEEV